MKTNFKLIKFNAGFLAVYTVTENHGTYDHSFMVHLCPAAQMKGMVIKMIKPDYLVKDIYCLTDDFLNDNNVKGVIFDIDNTLVGFTVAKPDKKVAGFISSLKEKGFKVAIASNNNKHRVSTFCEELDVDYISRACKPLPFSLYRIAKRMGVKCKNVMLVGDQVFTDVWGANLLGMTSVMVDIIDTKETLTFKVKRALEKPIIKAKIREDARKNG